MITTAILALGPIALAWPLMGRTSLPGSVERDRRLRWVARHPDQANAGDIRKLMARKLPADQVELVSARAAHLGILPFTMWLWIHRFDVEMLALAVNADLTHAEFLAHLGTGVAPDLETLQVFAAINGHPTGPARPAATQAAVRRRRPIQPQTNLPEITDPGGWPFDTWEPPAASGPDSFAA